MHSNLLLPDVWLIPLDLIKGHFFLQLLFSSKLSVQTVGILWLWQRLRPLDLIAFWLLSLWVTPHCNFHPLSFFSNCLFFEYEPFSQVEGGIFIIIFLVTLQEQFGQVSALLCLTFWPFLRSSLLSCLLGSFSGL